MSLEEAKPKYQIILFLSAVTVVIFLAWASTSEIDQQVRGFGRIIPSSEKKTVQHLEGGIVTEILVKEGDTVEAGDPLFLVRNQGADSELEEIRIRLLATRIEHERLTTEYRGDDNFEIPAYMAEKAPEMAANQQSLFRSRKAQFSEQISVLDERKRQKTLKLDELQSQLKNVEAERRTAQEQYDINKRLKASGAISESRFLESQSQLQNFNTRVSTIRKQIPIVKAELSEAINEIRGAKERIRAKIGEELSNKNVELRQIEERIKSSSDIVERSSITSPVKGIVQKIYFNTLGGVVRPGVPLADIIPLDDSLIVDAKIQTNDRGKIWPGLPVRVNITAYDYTIYGGLNGELVSISPDSIKEENGTEYYQVRISLSDTNLGQDRPVYPGMTAEINILTGKRKIIDYVLRPFREIGANAFRD